VSEGKPPGWDDEAPTEELGDLGGGRWWHRLGSDEWITHGGRIVWPPRLRRLPRGRHRWTATLYRQRYAAAEAATSDPKTLSRIAERFVGLNRDKTTGDPVAGIDPEALARLHRRYRRGELPE